MRSALGTIHCSAPYALLVTFDRISVYTIGQSLIVASKWMEGGEARTVLSKFELFCHSVKRLPSLSSIIHFIHCLIVRLCLTIRIICIWHTVLGIQETFKPFLMPTVYTNLICCCTSSKKRNFLHSINNINTIYNSPILNPQSIELCYGIVSMVPSVIKHSSVHRNTHTHSHSHNKIFRAGQRYCWF